MRKNYRRSPRNRSSSNAQVRLQWEGVNPAEKGSGRDISLREGAEGRVSQGHVIEQPNEEVGTGGKRRGRSKLSGSRRMFRKKDRGKDRWGEIPTE